MRMSFMLPGGLLSILFSVTLVAQPGNPGVPANPLTDSRSPIFGKDIVINDQPGQNQQGVAVCSAFNGWLYSAFSYNNTDNQTSVTIFRSTDNGITWGQFFDGSVGMPGITAPKIEIMACGSTETDLKLFIGILFYDTVFLGAGASVNRINGSSGVLESLLFENNNVRDFALANDNLYPAVSSNPYSIALLVSKLGTADSLILLTSSNGGTSFDNQKIVDLEPQYSPNISKKVGLSYGYSSSQSTGRYFAVWEKQNKYSTADLGHVYSAHSEPHFNSPITIPVCLDCFDTSLTNRCNTPVIACQANDLANDSSNLTAIILFQKFIPASNEFALHSMYNMQATSSGYFKSMTIAPSIYPKLQADICYNPFDSNFVITCFSPTDHKLPLITNNFNLRNPDSWNIESQGYNDQPDIEEPYPKVELNNLLHSTANVWIENRYSGNNSAMFDAQYSTYTGLYDREVTISGEGIKIFPSPANSIATIEFESKSKGTASIKLFDQLGILVSSETRHTIHPGTNCLKFNVMALSTGIYLCTVESDGFITTGKFVVIK